MAPRQIPCQRCRSSHLACHWPADTENAGTCERCTDDGVTCSGPKAKARLPCKSCRRIKTRCKWEDGSEICMRCKSYDSPICPMPAQRMRQKRIPFSNSTAENEPSAHKEHLPSVPSPTDGQSQVLEVAMSKSMRETLARQGDQRFTGIQFDHLKALEKGRLGQSESITDELILIANMVAGLRFANVLGVNGSSTTTSHVVPIEEVTKSHWLDGRRGKATFQVRALENLSTMSWEATYRILSSTSMTASELLCAVVGLRVLTKLRIFRRDREQDKLVRSALACVVIHAGLRLGESVDEQERAALVEGARILATREAQLSMELESPSLIDDIAFSTVFMQPRLYDSRTTIENICTIIRSGLDPTGQVLRKCLAVDLLEPVHDALTLILRGMVASRAYKGDTQTRWIEVDQVYALMDDTRNQILAAAGYQQGHTLAPVFWKVAQSILCVELYTFHVDLLTVLAHRQIRYPYESTSQRFLFDAEATQRLSAGLQRIAGGLRIMDGPEVMLSRFYTYLEPFVGILALHQMVLPDYVVPLSPEDAFLLIEHLNIASYWDHTAMDLIPAILAGVSRGFHPLSLEGDQ